MTLQRVDFELAKASGSADGYAQYVSSLTFSSHWCYWESRDIMLFVLETLDRQRLAHDFFDTDTGRSWLSRAEHLLAHLVHGDDDGRGGGEGGGGGGNFDPSDLLRRSGVFLQGLQGVQGAGSGWIRHARDGGGGWGGTKPLVSLLEGFKGAADAGAAAMRSEARVSDRSEASERAAFLASVKAKVLDFLMQYLTKLEVPPLTFSRPPPGEMHYAIGSIVLSAVHIPPHELLVTTSGRTLTVKASDVSATLKDLTWMYKQKHFPYLRDRGTGDAEVRGLSLWLSLDVEALGGQDMTPTHTDTAGRGAAPAAKGCEKRALEASQRVRIKELVITLHKAKLPPWLYNVILALFSHKVKGAGAFACVYVCICTYV